MPSSASSNADGQTKGVQCSMCGKRFSRTDHLKRHQLRHSGIKPYSCIFCSDAFTRSDNLREHYPGCPQRQNRQIPEAARGGRRSHACDSCTSMKLGCDGGNPCKTCRHKRIECRFSRLMSKGGAGLNEISKGTENGQCDRGSINFLLNTGTASFIDCFRLPSSHERRNIWNFRTAKEATTSIDSVNFFGNNSSEGNVSSTPFDDESIDRSLLDEANLLTFLGGSFGVVPMFGSEAPITGFSLIGDFEAPTPQSAMLVQEILESSMTLQMTPPEQEHVLQNLRFLFTPSRIEKFVGLYFEFWHPHCSIIYKPAFSIHTTTLPLLAAMSVMGAMYTPIDTEITTARLVLDLVELYIFSLNDLSDVYEIRHMLRVASVLAPENTQLSVLAFDNLQAAYILVCVQFWAGNMVSRKRAVDTRFNSLVKVARRLGLMKARHEVDDGQDEQMWILRETRIRMINTMTLFDCAFCFFVNFPCRISVSEMEFDLPCEESFFASHHPFSEPGFTFSRNITTVDAFQSLFKPSQISQGPSRNPYNLNPADMFILIHMLYVSAHTQIIHFPTSISRSEGDPDTSTPAGPLAQASESGISAIKTALSNWRLLWIAIRASIPNDAWAALGFFRNGYNYWLVTQLIISHKGSADILMKMEVGCEDTLKQLRLLLKDGSAET
ncbi:uncharacterized protein L3040_006245 [Drepanopeziza brunnea f. sp. 'multigermtubi']|uniref:uncharacterized protein n=1 Tax=Drepanopeziza brunnea f. sp. 'multigermtubi' TaxID=698441 RepID=UPI0023845FD3|nr:hypothetical protein L3040_006245 [Drepanopeziza brunnea f. sp. 'multigermtubi']